MKKKVVTIIQARMGSTRLPGKVLKLILGKPMLWHLIKRVKNSRLVDDLIVATSNNKKDNKILSFCLKNNIKVFRGSENNVLERFYNAARLSNADIIVRITADCPLIDPKVIDETIKLYKKGSYDYVAVATGAGVAKDKINKFPDGMDCEVFSTQSLEKAFQKAKDPLEQEHATMYIWKRLNLFKIGQLPSERDFSTFRFVVDHREDLLFVRRIYEELYPKNKLFSLKEIINLLNQKPNLLKINSKYLGQEGYKDLWENNIEKKLKKDFTKYQTPKSILSRIQAVVILSAEEIDLIGENRERVAAGLKLNQKLKTALLIFLGTKKHNQRFEKYLRSINFKGKLAVPTNRNNASTKTQIMDLAKFVTLKKLNNLVIVSHTYHIPRIKRYCKKNLPNTNIFFQGVGDIKAQKNKIGLEIKKIKKYSKRKDLELFA